MPERPGRDARAGLWDAGAVVRPAGSDGSDGVGLSSTGALSVDGLTWLGARVYDPATRSFLSRDPLPPVLGAGWAANPYSWAGNDPVNLADPSGAHPLTDAEMEAWRDSHKTGLAAVGDYLADNWQYIVGGIVLGTVLTAVCGPVLGGALTGAIISGWQNVDQQAASGGPFDVGGFVGAVVLGGASGAIGGAVAQGVAGTALARGMGCLGRSTLVGGVSGTAAGGSGASRLVPGCSWPTGPPGPSRTWRSGTGSPRRIRTPAARPPRRSPPRSPTGTWTPYACPPTAASWSPPPPTLCTPGAGASSPPGT